ncbi:zinc-binding dehydrogenase [Micromonospora ureilytica]
MPAASFPRPDDSGDIPLRVADVYPFADAAAAHERLAQGGVRGSVVIVP